MRLLRLVFRDFHIKLVALFVALVVWFYAVLERVHTTTVDLPVTVGKVTAGMVVAHVETTQVRAQLSGKGRDLMLLRLRKAAIRLNVTGDNPGRSRVKLTQEQTSLPASVQLLSARPEYIGVDLDQQSRRQARVLVPTRGKPPGGKVVTQVKPLDNVYVTGAREEIGMMASVSTESLYLSDLMVSTERRLRVMLPAGSRFGVEPESINVSIKVETEEIRTFDAVTLNVFKSTGRTVTVRPQSARIIVSGAADRVKVLTLQDVAATLKITDTLPQGISLLPCEISLPPGVALVKCEPVRFEVEVQ